MASITADRDESSRAMAFAHARYPAMRAIAAFAITLHDSSED
jgi:hypothetical protein